MIIDAQEVFKAKRAYDTSKKRIDAGKLAKTYDVALGLQHLRKELIDAVKQATVSE